MSRTRNANSILVGTTSEETVAARRATQVLAATIFAALLAVPVASALIRPPVQPVATPSRLASTAPLPSNVHTPGVQSEPGAPPAPRTAHRIYLLGSFPRTSILSPAKVKAKTKASTVLKPTAVKIAANRTGGSANKVQQVFSIH